ncbi:exosortase E/protease, VPEID-CTERM system [Jannaschia sp. LMIT008]|uniref:exosortase E/protease, VPEID-CTERM system n=1 Tax=Jannaschia maritima TaxID=3032585 RepID=UPI002811ECBD|nr:exosortase E/protease, VPEID-CTERM system [Jannaschia sp. LMIT008]
MLTAIGFSTLFLGQLTTVAFLYKHLIPFDCRANWPAWACSGASMAVIAIYCIAGALALFAAFRMASVRDLVQDAGYRTAPILLNMGGLLAALTPIALILTDPDGSLRASLLLWGAGLSAMTAGFVLSVAPPHRLIPFLSRERWDLGLSVLLGAAAPFLATMLYPLWRVEAVADATFDAVVLLVGSAGFDVHADATVKGIGIDGFYISVAPVCSGVEGMALVSVFVTLFLTLFRSNLRFPHALILFPLGIAASALFNVLRISILLIIGGTYSPELAVGAFHSHAGWMMFTLVALGIVAVGNAIPWIQRASAAGAAGAVETRAVPPLRRDPVVARILPLGVFMLSAVFASVLTDQPALLYPLRMLAVAAALALFWRIYAALDWRVAPVSVLAGTAIAILWILVPVAPQGAAPYGALTGVLLIGWLIARGIGTTILVPLVEELFFREYMERRLQRRDTWPWVLLSIGATTALFAVLHGRWWEAAVAGLIFSLLRRHTGRISDAIVAHAIANGLIFAVAAWTGRFELI